LRTKKQFGFDEYGDLVAVDHLACRAGQVLAPHTIEEALSGNEAGNGKLLQIQSTVRCL